MSEQGELPGVSRCCSPDSYSREQARAHGETWWQSPFVAARRNVQSCFLYAHEDLGLPWWAALALGGFSIRLACMPLVLKAAAVSSNWAKGQRSAMRHITYILGEPSIDHLRPAVATHDARKKLLAVKLAPGSPNRLWMAAPLAQVCPLTSLLHPITVWLLRSAGYDVKVHLVDTCVTGSGQAILRARGVARSTREM